MNLSAKLCDSVLGWWFVFLEAFLGSDQVGWAACLVTGSSWPPGSCVPEPRLSVAGSGKLATGL